MSDTHNAEDVAVPTAAEKARLWAEKATRQACNPSGGNEVWERRYVRLANMWAAVALAEATHSDGAECDQ